MEARPLKDLPIGSNFIVDFNWESNIPSRTIRDTVTISFVEENENSKEEDITEIIDVDRTADFEQPSKCIDKPILILSVPEAENFYISRLCVACDCKIIEVFAEQGMYIDTIHGSVLDDCDNFCAYEFTADLNSKMNKKITINFLKLNTALAKNRLWIYGISLTLKPMARQNLNSSINFDNVQELLKDSQLSEKASKCYKFLKQSMTNPQFISERMVAPVSSITNTSQSEGSNTDKVAELKQYIDYKFQVLTEFLILRERNLHDKLDSISDYIKSQQKRN